MSYTKIQACEDMMIMEILLSSNNIIKSGQSGAIESIIKGIAGRVESNIDPNNKMDSVLNLLAPGILMASGFPILSFIAEIATQWFGIDLGAIFSDIASAIKSLIIGGQQVSSSTVDNIATKAVASHTGGEPTKEDFEAAQQKKISVNALSITEAKLYKAAVVELMSRYSMNDISSKNINKKANFLTDMASFVGLKGATSRVLMKVIGWIVKTVLWSGGFMLANDAIHSVLGIPKTNPTGSSTQNVSLDQTPSIAFSAPKQTIFPVNPAYSEEKLNINSRWVEPVPIDSIDQDIVQWAKDIYPDLKDKDSEIRNTNGFQKAVEIIKDYNKTNTSNITFIPKLFTSKKKVVDLFIDEVASKSTSPNSSPSPSKPSAISI